MTGRKNDYIHADIRLFRTRKSRCVTLVLAGIALVLLAAFLIPIVQKYGLAEEFVTTLYTTTQEDWSDPTPRVEQLRTLATDELVDELLVSGGIPAVVLHEKGVRMETGFAETPRGVGEKAMPGEWTDELPGKVRIHDLEGNKLLSGWRGVMGVCVEKVNGQYRVTDISRINWQMLYPIDQ